MADNQFSPEQMEKLIAYASGRLGTTPEQLKALFQQEGLAGLANLAGGSTFTAQETTQAQELLKNKDNAAQLLNDPKVQGLLRQLLGE